MDWSSSFRSWKRFALSHSWFGNVAMNRDMIPRIFEKDGIVYATGFCGSGVVWAPWVGMRAAHKLMGDAEKARSAFDFRPPAAVPLYRGDPWFMPARHSGLWLAGQDCMVARPTLSLVPGRIQTATIAATKVSRLRPQVKLNPWTGDIDPG